MDTYYNIQVKDDYNNTTILYYKFEELEGYICFSKMYPNLAEWKNKDHVYEHLKKRVITNSFKIGIIIDLLENKLNVINNDLLLNKFNLTYPNIELTSSWDDENFKFIDDGDDIEVQIIDDNEGRELYLTFNITNSYFKLITCYSETSLPKFINEGILKILKTLI